MEGLEWRAAAEAATRLGWGSHCEFQTGKKKEDFGDFDGGERERERERKVLLESE